MSILLRYSPNDALQEDEYTEKEKICPREGLGVPLADGQNVFGRAIQQEVGASEAKTPWMMLLETISYSKFRQCMPSESTKELRLPGVATRVCDRNVIIPALTPRSRPLQQ